MLQPELIHKIQSFADELSPVEMQDLDEGLHRWLNLLVKLKLEGQINKGQTRRAQINGRNDNLVSRRQDLFEQACTPILLHDYTAARYSGPSASSEPRGRGR